MAGVLFEPNAIRALVPSSRLETAKRLLSLPDGFSPCHLLTFLAGHYHSPLNQSFNLQTDQASMASPGQRCAWPGWYEPGLLPKSSRPDINHRFRDACKPEDRGFIPEALQDAESV